MKKLFLIVGLISFFAFNLFSQTKDDVVEIKNINLFLLDTLVYEKIKEHQRDFYSKRVKPLDYGNSKVSSIVNLQITRHNADIDENYIIKSKYYDCYFEMNEVMSDTNLEVSSYHDSSLINSEVQNFVIVNVYGRDKIMTETAALLPFGNFQMTLGNLLQKIHSSIYRYSYYPRPNEPKNVNYEKTSIKTSIENGITYNQLSEMIFDQIMNEKIFKKRIDGSLGLAVDINPKINNSFVTTLIVTK